MIVTNSLPNVPVIPYGKEIEYQVVLPQKTLTYKIIDAPLSYDERLNLLKKENEDLVKTQKLMQGVIDELLMRGM